MGAFVNEDPLSPLIRILAGLPGLGHRSARRIALHMLHRKDTLMLPLAELLKQTAENTRRCGQCGNFDVQDPCHICRDERRDHSKICVIARISDLWAIERTGSYKGVYFVLGGLLSALDGIGPDDLRLETLRMRVENGPAAEVILALSATVDGQSTAHFIADLLDDLDVIISRLAHGVPVGGELDYLDDGTIATALQSRSAA